MVTDRFTKEEANVLTAEGFRAYCIALRNSMTHIQAYEATEVIHQRVHKDGKRKYAEFTSYERLAYLKKKASPNKELALNNSY